jgi:hypothetical protein
MKKILSFMVMAIVMVLPLTVKADVNLDDKKWKCSEANANNEVTCVINATFDDGNLESLTLKLNEYGGAEILKIESVATSDWTVQNQVDKGTYWDVTVSLNGPGQAGEFDLFSVTYKASGLDDCKIGVELNGIEIKTPEPKETPRGKCVEDKVNKKYYIDDVEVTESQYKEQCTPTGATLPYLALGAMVVLAAAAYVTTKNKTKMYKI